MQDVPKIVRARLQRQKLATAEPHPDADLLTAFAEHSLAGRERDHVLDHLARCGECREAVALALPATEAVALASSESTARIGWLSWPILRWGVVAAGILAVTSVGILQYRQRHQEKTLVASSFTPHAPADTAAQSPASAPRATASQAFAPQAAKEKQIELPKQTPSPSRVSSQLAATNPAPAPAAIPAQPQPMRRSSSASSIGGPIVGHGFASAIGRSSTAVEVSPQSSAEPAAADQLETDQWQTLSRAKPVPDQASSALPPAPRTDPALMGSAALRWTISDGGALRRSLDGGKTWLDVNVAADSSPDSSMSSQLELPAPTTTGKEQAEPTTQASTETNQTEKKSNAKSAARSAASARVQFAGVEPASVSRPVFRALAVSSNAAEVWAGGSGGALYHTLDGGNRWLRVLPSDAGVLLTGDIIAIQFSDPRNGTVTTSNVEIWITADAGQTWHKQQ